VPFGLGGSSFASVASSAVPAAKEAGRSWGTGGMPSAQVWVEMIGLSRTPEFMVIVRYPQANPLTLYLPKA
jgi:hypothetical protein